MDMDNHKVRRSYGRVHGVVTHAYAHSFDVARHSDGMTVHALIPDRLATMARGLGKRFTSHPHRTVTAADLPHIPDFTGGLGSVAYVRQLRGDE